MSTTGIPRIFSRLGHFNLIQTGIFPTKRRAGGFAQSHDVQVIWTSPFWLLRWLCDMTISWGLQFWGVGLQTGMLHYLWCQIHSMLGGVWWLGPKLLPGKTFRTSQMSSIDMALYIQCTSMEVAPAMGVPLILWNYQLCASLCQFLWFPKTEPLNLCIFFLGGLPSLKLTARTCKLVVGRWSFPFGFRPIFRGELLVSGRVVSSS